MSNAILYRMPSGIPGDVSRKSHSTIEAHLIVGDSATYGLKAYGLFGKIDPTNGKFVPVTSGDTGVYGLLVRSYPTQSAMNDMGAAVPQENIMHDVLVRGYMTVRCNAGNAKKGGKVYVRLNMTSVLKPAGGIEAVADGANTLELKNAMFMHDADAQGNVEISYNI